jgi:hypothetical protein
VLHYLLGLGIFSVSYSILRLMKAREALAIPLTLLSLFLAALAEHQLGANFFLILLGSVMALSTATGHLSERDPSPKGPVSRGRELG